MKKEQSLETQEEHDEEAASVDLSETPHGEDTTSDNVTPTTSKSKDKPPEIITEGARWVLFSKILVLLVLMGCAAAAAYIAYDFTSDNESQEFENQFSGYADELIEVSKNTAFSTFSVLESFSKTITSLALFANIEWPLLEIPHFEVRAYDYLASSGAQLVSFAPVVTEEMRDQWEPFSVANQDWVQAGLQYEAEEKGGDTPTAEPIVEQIWRNALRSSTPVREYAAGPFVPLWQSYPAPQDSLIVNYSLMSHPSFEKLIKMVMETRVAVLSEIIDNTVLFGTAKSDDLNPKSVVVQPVFRDFENDADIVGFLVVIIPWDVYFHNVLFAGAHPIVAVLKNSCGDSFSYRVSGPQAHFLGEGDMHESRFEELEVSSEFANYTKKVIGNATTTHSAHSRGGLKSSCDYSVHIYPSSDMEDTMRTNMPMLVTAGVVIVFGFTSLVFILYDTIVQRRQRRVQNQANRTHKIVASLFPAEVHDRLFGTEDEVNGKKGALKSRAPKFHLMNFLSEEEQKNAEDGGEPRTKSKPIADLFPSATVMFCDISGFTAWSSVREPSQVFILLETVYNAFDRIAKKRKVFKVETIGDSYLAVCGLPTPRKDHAVVMARFASDCCVEFRRLCHHLEVELGPDTSELGMRFGLHSGPVTAGVLRGEKTRFQLFGDTVNTASRMETSSERNRIQASFETAALLREAGKGKWLVPRDKLIFAKGKGNMQTYFVHPKTAASRSNTSGSSDENASEVMSEDFKDPALIDKIPTNSTGKVLDRKCQRAADWISEILVRLLKQMVARRIATGRPEFGCSKSVIALAQSMNPETGKQVLDEMHDVIYLPKYDAKAAKKQVDPDSVRLPQKVLDQVRDFVNTIATMYRDNPFHTYNHAAHVTMSVSKLLSRIVAPELVTQAKELDSKLHDHTYGITSDPLTQFAVVFSAMIHDVDHPGIPNATLVRDNTQLANYYKNKSVAEQNSVDLSWALLMDKAYQDLCGCIFTNEDELKRFRALVVNAVMATDIADKELGAKRKERWAKAFSSENCAEKNGNLTELDVINRKATIVIEHIIQASDVSHTMQHWQIYLRWNEKLFEEMFVAYQRGMSDKNPADFWYKGELGFYDFYIIPLAKKLKDCGVFGVSSDEYLSYALSNRAEWEERGRGIVSGYLEKYSSGKDAAHLEAAENAHPQQKATEVVV